MSGLRWERERRVRPDPYLDWELRNRPAGENGERWCSLLLRIEPGPVNAPAANLRRLEAGVTGANVAISPEGALRLAMNGDELARLRDAIAALEAPQAVPPPPEAAIWEVFAYAPEEETYAQGRLAHRPGFFQIAFAGPPILASLSDKAGALAPTSPRPASAPLLSAPMVSAPMVSPRASFTGPVAIGVIDDGIAFAHERFRGTDAEGRPRTRIAALWLQDIETVSQERHVTFGTVLKGADIDRLLLDARSPGGGVDEAAVYRAAGRWDFRRERREMTELRAAHGTHVMDIACGADPFSARDQDEALDRPILAVQLPDSVTADTSGVRLGSYVLQALRQIMLWADHPPAGADAGGPSGPLPLVVNFSYGFTAGPKDGSHPLERRIARLVAERDARVPTMVVLPAGNTHAGRLAADMTLAPRVSQRIDWSILPDDATPSFVEIWFAHHGEAEDCPLAITLTPPLGPPGAELRPTPDTVHVLRGEGPICAISYDPMREDGQARIFLAVNPTKTWDAATSTAPAGAWGIALTNMTAAPVAARLGIQRDDTPAGFRMRGRQSRFDHPAAHGRDPVTGDYDALGAQGPITHAGTLSAIATGQGTFVVGAARDGERLAPSDYTASGPTPGRAAPDVSAIADDGEAFPGILAAGSASGSFVIMRGTSVAAPRVTRALAENGLRPAHLEGTRTAPTAAVGSEAVASGNDTAPMDERRLGRLVLKARPPAAGQRRAWPRRDEAG